MNDRMVLHQDSRHQHSFSKSKSCLTNLVAFCDGVTTPVNKGRATDGIYVASVKPLTLSPHNLLLSKLERDGFDGWTVR